LTYCVAYAVGISDLFFFYRRHPFTADPSPFNECGDKDVWKLLYSDYFISLRKEERAECLQVEVLDCARLSLLFQRTAPFYEA
jgi:hypothetical protein